MLLLPWIYTMMHDLFALHETTGFTGTHHKHYKLQHFEASFPVGYFYVGILEKILKYNKV